MSNETPPVNGAEIHAGNEAAVDMAEQMAKAKDEFLGRVVRNVENGFSLLEMTNEDVAKVSLNLMLNSFLEGYRGNVMEATQKMEDFVSGSMRATRHAESSKLILPPGVMQQ